MFIFYHFSHQDGALSQDSWDAIDFGSETPKRYIKMPYWVLLLKL